MNAVRQQPMTGKHQPEARGAVAADVRDHCRDIGATASQTKAAVNVALNFWMREADAQNQIFGNDITLSERQALSGEAIREGNRIADQLVGENSRATAAQ